MTTDKTNRPRARVAKGFRDIGPDEIRGVKRMMRTIEEVYERYGFEPVEQPFVEYTDALGKFLPDQDRPNAGVFSFQDDDDQWLSLRYDLTAPMARYVAENQQSLVMPYRSYRSGWVFRNEKPGPGRYRQFMQFDADTVGTASPAADAEVCMMAADTMEALGIPRGQYVVRVNNRKILDGALQAYGLDGEENADRRFTVFRAMDKHEKLGSVGVRQLLGAGRKDESGDFTKGAELSPDQIERVMLLLESPFDSLRTNESKAAIWANEKFSAGLDELSAMQTIFKASGFDQSQIRIDPSVVRGLEYYTGPVFECELLMETKDEDGRPVRFGSVGGGGRYDDLVARFTGQAVPATGFSIGVSRLYSALKLVGKVDDEKRVGPVIVTVMDRDRVGHYQSLTQRMRHAFSQDEAMKHVQVEMYVGTSSMKAQLKYADRRNASLAIIQGSNEREKGEVQIKDLRLGAELAKGIESREVYAGQRLAQISVPEAELVDAVKKALAR